jgi:hypothetical protein
VIGCDSLGGVTTALKKQWRGNSSEIIVTLIRMAAMQYLTVLKMQYITHPE